MKTNYSEAWKKYLKSNSYKETVENMKTNGINQPYAGNILENAFAAGWNASGIKIEIIQP